MRIVTVSPEMDTIDLLGGFEQADIYRKIEETLGGIREVVGRVVKWIVSHHGPNLTPIHTNFLHLSYSFNSLTNLTPGK